MRSVFISTSLLFVSLVAAQTRTSAAPTATGTIGPCETIEAIIDVCSSLNGPEFDNASAYDQASCLCFNSDGSFEPSIWDDNSVDCVSHGTNQDIIAALTANSNLGVNLCSKYADAVAAETASGAASSAVATETFNGGARTTNLPNATGTSSMVIGGARTRTPTGGSTFTSATVASVPSSTRTAAPTTNGAGHVKVGGAALLVGLGLAIVA